MIEWRHTGTGQTSSSNPGSISGGAYSPNPMTANNPMNADAWRPVYKPDLPKPKDTYVYHPGGSSRSGYKPASLDLGVPGQIIGGITLLCVFGLFAMICLFGYVRSNPPKRIPPKPLVSPFKTGSTMIGGKLVTANFYRSADLNRFPSIRLVDGHIAPPLLLPDTAVVIGDLKQVSLQTLHPISVQGNVDNCVISTSNVPVEVHGQIVSTTIGTYGGTITGGAVEKSELRGRVVRYASIDSESVVNSKPISK